MDKKSRSEDADHPVRWLPGWYATRLHAVADQLEWPPGRRTIRAACGAFVYPEAPTEWAAKKVAKGVTRCKKCEKTTGPRVTIERG